MQEKGKQRGGVNIPTTDQAKLRSLMSNRESVKRLRIQKQESIKDLIVEARQKDREISAPRKRVMDLENITRSNETIIRILKDVTELPKYITQEQRLQMLWDVCSSYNEAHIHHEVAGLAALLKEYHRATDACDNFEFPNHLGS